MCGHGVLIDGSSVILSPGMSTQCEVKMCSEVFHPKNCWQKTEVKRHKKKKKKGRWYVKMNKHLMKNQTVSFHLHVWCMFSSGIRLSFNPVSNLEAAQEEGKILTCSSSLDYIPSCCVSINQRFAIILY